MPPQKKNTKEIVEVSNVCKAVLEKTSTRFRKSGADFDRSRLNIHIFLSSVIVPWCMGFCNIGILATAVVQL